MSDTRTRNGYFQVVALSILVLSLPGAGYADSFSGEVVRAMFTTNIKRNEPQNEVLILENDKRTIYFFTEVQNIKGKAIFFQWEYEGDVVKKQRIKLKKGKTKYYSKYRLLQKQTGKWTVVITNEKGWPLKASIFKYVKKGKK